MEVAKAPVGWINVLAIIVGCQAAMSFTTYQCEFWLEVNRVINITESFLQLPAEDNEAKLIHYGVNSNTHNELL